MFGLFRRTPRRDSDAVEALKTVVRERLALPPEATVTISEIQCGDPSCPGNETVVLVMRPGQRARAYRVPAPLAEVEAEDVAAALIEEDGALTPSPPSLPLRP
jgi:hypothetical protein